jgi:medium-chain acyl-[acyl-carrier-protein] hydrolase
VTQKSPWLVCFQPVAEPTLRLFCIPYAGGGAMVYRKWPAHLPIGVELWSIRLPGRETRHREPAFFRLAPLIDALAHELEPKLDLPYAIFGHSLGALIGFELARHLEREAVGPGHLFVSAHGGPRQAPSSAPLHLATDDQILRRLRRLGGTPEAFYESHDLVAALLPNIRRDFAMAETYRYEDSTPLRCPLTVFAADGDQSDSAQSMSGWADVGSGEHRLVTFPGGHFYWSDDAAPLLDEIGADLRATFGAGVGASRQDRSSLGRAGGFGGGG